MKIFLAVFLLYIAPIIASKVDLEYEKQIFVERMVDDVSCTVATMGDNSFTCSKSCIEIAIQWDEQLPEHIRPDKDIAATYSAYLDAICYQYPKVKQCLSQCSDGSLKATLTTLSTSIGTMCFDKVKSMIKNNIKCVSDPSIFSISQQCMQICPVPDCRENGSYPQYLYRLNIPTLLKKCGAKVCGFCNCMTQCFTKRLITDTKCDPKTIGMINDLIAETARSFASVIINGGMTTDEIPIACKKLARA